MWLGWQMFPADTMPWVHSPEHHVYTNTIPALRRRRQKDQMFKVKLGHIVNSSQPGMYETQKGRKKTVKEKKNPK